MIQGYFPVGPFKGDSLKGPKLPAVINNLIEGKKIPDSGGIVKNTSQFNPKGGPDYQAPPTVISDLFAHPDITI